jgi:poly(glycerol-phosphate) alpha-glucosyltransferase
MYAAIKEPRLQLAERLGAMEIYGIRDCNSRLDLESWKPIPARAFPAVGPESFGYTPKLLKALHDGAHDIVHQHGVWMYPSIAVRQWAKVTGRPTVLSAHGMLDAWAIENNAWRKRLAFWLYEGNNLRGATCLHALSLSEANAYRSLGLTNPIAIIPNGISLPNIRAVEAPKWAHSDQRNVVLFLGRIHPKKGLLHLIDCWRILTQTNQMVADTWALVIAGWGDRNHEADLRKRIRERGLQRQIHVLGPLFGAEKERVLSHARAFILPSFSEGHPMAVLEAWSFARPVLMTKYCNLDEGFKVGAAFEIGLEPPAMAETISSVLADERALRAAGQRGRELVERCFTWATVAEQLTAVYTWLVRGGSCPAVVEEF